MMHRPLPGNRHDVEMKVPTIQMECEHLRDVLALLEGQTGVAHVFDRHSQALLVVGAVNDVRDALGEVAAVDPAEGCDAHAGTLDVASARSNELEKGQESRRHRGYKVQISGALSIASAYYFGDLGGVVRRRDGNGQDTFFRPKIARLRTAG